MAGEDSRRGTFSQRHATLIDYENERNWTPLNDLGGRACSLRVYDSAAVEYAARVRVRLLRGEQGRPGAGKRSSATSSTAQIVIDQYAVAAEDKWGQTSGPVLLLPHGYEGQGPEHSSARSSAS